MQVFASKLQHAAMQLDSVDGLVGTANSGDVVSSLILPQFADEKPVTES